MGSFHYITPFTSVHSQEWDEDLARLAQFYSANCEYMRNEHRHDQSDDYDYVGENIAATGEPHTQVATLSENAKKANGSIWHFTLQSWLEPT